VKEEKAVAKKKSKKAQSDFRPSRLDEFLQIAKIHQLEASAAKDRQETHNRSLEIFGPFRAT
jgi:Holliday junction resolvasome RuvABC ATP-dependent DNA helicase subunit